MAMPATPFWLSWLGLQRRSPKDAAGLGSGQLPADMRRTPSDPPMWQIGAQLGMHSDGDRAGVTAMLTGWIARLERSMGGGVLDLVLFPDALWREEAVRSLAWPEGDRMAAPGTCEQR